MDRIDVLEAEDPGLQSTLQAGPRTGLGHMGVPSCGAADGLSLALANRLVGNLPDACGLEITLSGCRLHVLAPTLIAVTGGACDINLNRQSQQGQTAFVARSGDTLTLGALTSGARAYLAVAGGLAGQDWLRSPSTYLPAGRGGYNGRALQAGDRIGLCVRQTTAPVQINLQTPEALRPHIGHSWMLRAVPGPDFDHLLPDARASLFASAFTLSRRASRMGAALEGQILKTDPDLNLPSAAVFPGTLQCPPGGTPFLLMADAGTMGGYPRIAQVIRADRHMLGQLRPGDRVQFMQTDADAAALALREKTALLRDWLGDAFQL